MSKRYAVVRDGQIENVILWDGVTEFDPGVGVDLVLEDEALKTGTPRAEVVVVDAASPAADGVVIAPDEAAAMLAELRHATTVAGLKNVLDDFLSKFAA